MKVAVVIQILTLPQTMLVDPNKDVEMDDGLYNAGFADETPAAEVNTPAHAQEPIYATPQGRVPT